MGGLKDSLRRFTNLIFRKFNIKDSNERRIDRLRRKGVKIGRECIIFTEQFSTEPYLVELGNHVGIAGGTMFLTHDASIWLIRDQRPKIQHFGKITVGDNTYIGQNCVILPGTRIGSRCIIGAGAVVRGRIPDNSLVIGNPCKVVGRASLLLERMIAHEDTFDSLDMSYEERKTMLQLHFSMNKTDKT